MEPLLRSSHTLRNAARLLPIAFPPECSGVRFYLDTRIEMAKRSYTRRSDEQLILELQEKLKRVEKRIEAKQRADAPVLKEVSKLTRALRRFAQVATDHDRIDLANMTLAFQSGLDRAANELPKKASSRNRRENASA